MLLPDITAPKLIYINGNGGSDDESAKSNLISVQFNEDIKRGEGSIVIKKIDGTIVSTYDYLSEKINVIGSTLLIDSANNLNSHTVYKIEFSSTAICDLSGNYLDNMITIDYAKVNQIPVATSEQVITDEDVLISQAAQAFDKDDDKLIFRIIEEPLNGDLQLDSATGKYNYRPDLNYYGYDRFSYIVSDGYDISEQATVSIQVKPVNDPPQLSPFVLRLNSGESINEVLNASDAEDDFLKYSLSKSSQNGVVLINTDTGVFEYRPKSGFYGTDNFKYSVSDGQVTVESELISINVYKNLSIDSTKYKSYGLDLAKVMISGGAAPDSKIEISENDIIIGEAEVDLNGGWNFAYVTDYDRHSYKLKEIFIDGWRGKSQSIDLILNRDRANLYDIGLMFKLSDITKNDNSSFNEINRNYKLTVGYDNEIQSVVVVNAETQEKILEIKDSYLTKLGTNGEVIVTTQKSLSADDTDYKLDIYRLRNTAGELTFFKPNVGQLTSNYPSGYKETTGTTDEKAEFIGIGSTYEGNLIYQIKSKTSSIAIENYAGSYITPWHTDTWKDYFLAYPNLNSYSSGNVFFGNTGVRSIDIDPQGRYLSLSYIVGPADHVAMTFDIKQNIILRSVGVGDTSSFTFHLGSSSDGNVFSYIETPSWYGHEYDIIEYLSRSRVIVEKNGELKIIAEGAIPYQEISDDGKYILYHQYNSDFAGIHLYDISSGKDDLIQKFEKDEFNSNEKLIDQFLKFEYPRSVAASSYFFNKNIGLDNFVIVFPQIERGNMQAIGVPTAGTTISRILDFWDTPQNVPVLIVNPADLPAMTQPWEDYIFDIQSIYKLKSSVSTPTLKALTIIGEDSSQEILSGMGNDLIFAMDGSDTIQGDAGNDSVFAGSGDDLIIGGTGYGDDEYDGGDGIDVVKYTSATDAITVNLMDGIAFSTFGSDRARIGVDSLSHIENIVSGNYDDYLIGNDVPNYIKAENGNDSIKGGLGNDSIDGGAGIDTVYFDGLRKSYVVKKLSDSSLQIDSLIDGSDIISNVEYFHFLDKELSMALMLDSKSPEIAPALSDQDNIKLPVKTDLKIKFTEGVTLVGGVIYLKSVNGITLSALSNELQNVKRLNDGLLLGIKTKLDYGKSYFLDFSNSIIEDAAGNPLDGNSLYMFSTKNISIQYEFPQVCTWNSSWLATSKQNISQAITLSDVLDSLKLYLGKPIADPAPYKFIAADIDGNGVVNLSDVLGILKSYLGKNVSKGPEWVFIDKGYVEKNSLHIKSTSCAIEMIQYDQVENSNLDIVGVLRGDVNGSWLG